MEDTERSNSNSQNIPQVVQIRLFFSVYILCSTVGSPHDPLPMDKSPKKQQKHHKKDKKEHKKHKKEHKKHKKEHKHKKQKKRNRSSSSSSDEDSGPVKLSNFFDDGAHQH